MTNIIPYILSMAALVIIQKVAKVPDNKARIANIIAGIGALYSFYALYSSGEEAMMWAPSPPSSAGRCTASSRRASSWRVKGVKR